MDMKAKEPETLPAAVQVAAQTHIAMLEAALPGLLLSYYVTGSAALGDFRAGASDVDFIALTSRRPAPTEIGKLKAVHTQLNRKSLFAGLDGIYITGEDLEGSAEAQCPRFNGGKYLCLKKFDTGSPDAWVLKQYSVCLLGRKPEDLPFDVDWERLSLGMLANLEAYWRRWARGCRGMRPVLAFGLYLRPAMVEWGVLGISRLYFSLRERDVASKTGAGEYALQKLPEKCHSILREALSIRSGGHTPQYKSVIRMRNDALEYVEFMIEECLALTPQPEGNPPCPSRGIPP
jgi:hypothetical protein